MQDAKELAREIASESAEHYELLIIDVVCAIDTLTDKLEKTILRDRWEVIDECIEKAKGKRSYEVKDADDILWDDAVNQVLDTLESLKAEIGGGE